MSSIFILWVNPEQIGASKLSEYGSSFYWTMAHNARACLRMSVLGVALRCADIEERQNIIINDASSSRAYTTTEENRNRVLVAVI
jgi:hypothetical protein